MIGNELLWRLLQERCYEHYMEWRQAYAKKFSLLEKDLCELDTVSAAKFCPLQGKSKGHDKEEHREVAK
uniref:Uncharacterized protein n=1 Tax=Romanomermis culicivorax TaxID=13658 RepID=A0A915LBR3_ROMCU